MMENEQRVVKRSSYLSATPETGSESIIDEERTPLLRSESAVLATPLNLSNLHQTYIYFKEKKLFAYTGVSVVMLGCAINEAISVYRATRAALGLVMLRDDYAISFSIFVSAGAGLSIASLIIPAAATGFPAFIKDMRKLKAYFFSGLQTSAQERGLFIGSLMGGSVAVIVIGTYEACIFSVTVGGVSDFVLTLVKGPSSAAWSCGILVGCCLVLGDTALGGPPIFNFFLQIGKGLFSENKFSEFRHNCQQWYQKNAITTHILAIITTFFGGLGVMAGLGTGIAHMLTEYVDMDPKHALRLGSVAMSLGLLMAGGRNSINVTETFTYVGKNIGQAKRIFSSIPCANRRASIYYGISGFFWLLIIGLTLTDTTGYALNNAATAKDAYEKTFDKVMSNFFWLLPLAIFGGVLRICFQGASLFKGTREVMLFARKKVFHLPEEAKPLFHQHRINN